MKWSLFSGDCRFAEMSKAGALDLASGVGGKIQKDEVLSAVEKYEKKEEKILCFFSLCFVVFFELMPESLFWNFLLLFLRITENEISFALITLYNEFRSLTHFQSMPILMLTLLTVKSSETKV